MSIERTPTNDQIAAVLLQTGNPTDEQKEQLAEYLGRAPALEKEELLPAAQDALDRMKRAAERGTGCYLTAEMIQELNLTFLGQAWHEDRNR